MSHRRRRRFVCCRASVARRVPTLDARSRLKKFARSISRSRRMEGDCLRAADRFRQAQRFMQNLPVLPWGARRGEAAGSTYRRLGTLASGKPVKTPASYWPVATTLFDYIRRAMPITSPQSLTNDEVYAVTAYILSIDGIVPADAVLDAKILPRVKMPNKDGFVSWWPKAPR